MSYILLLILSSSIYTPTHIQLVEFQTKDACEVALREAKIHWETKNKESKCISVEEQMKKEKIKKELEGLK